MCPICATNGLAACRLALVKMGLSQSAAMKVMLRCIGVTITGNIKADLANTISGWATAAELKSLEVRRKNTQGPMSPEPL